MKGKVFLISMMGLAAAVALYIVRAERVRVPAKETSVQSPVEGTGDAPGVDPGGPQGLYNEAESLVAAGDLEGAKNLFIRIRKDYPEGPLATKSAVAIGKILFEQGQDYEARNMLSDAVVLLEGQEREQVKQILYKIVDQLVFSPGPFPESIPYVAGSGDTFVSLAKRFGTTPELIKRVNRREGSDLHAGESLKILRGDWTILVEKSRFRLILFLNGRFIREYTVAIGANGKTPEGTFLIETKQKNPTWFYEGEAIPFGDPRNLLGTRWLGFKATRGLSGFGIHGTVEPESIGKAVSQGCIRLQNADVEELFDIVPYGTEVTIRP